MRYVPRLERPLVEEAARHHHALWGAGRSIEDHVRHNVLQQEHAGPELLRYVGLIDDAEQLVASIKRYGLLLRDLEGREHRAVGIGAVFTPERARGKGFARRLLEHVLEEARDLGYGAAYLYSDIAPALYESLGFVVVDREEHAARTSDLPDVGALEARPATAAELDLVLAFHASSRTKERRVTQVRTRAIHRFFSWRNGTGAPLMMSAGGRDAGYLIASTVEPTRDLPDTRDAKALWLDEWAAPGVARERVLATVRRVAESLGAPRVEGWLPPAHRGAPFVAKERREAVAMVAPLHPSFAFDPRAAHLSAFEHF